MAPFFYSAGSSENLFNSFPLPAPVGKSYAEQAFLDHWLEAFPDSVPEQEHRFHPVRRWRFDFAWPELKLALEIDGARWGGGQGGHQLVSQMDKDHEKLNTAASMGWLVLHATPQRIKKDSDSVVDWLTEAASVQRLRLEASALDAA